MLLTILARSSSVAPSALAVPAAISEALDYDRFLRGPSTHLLLSSAFRFCFAIRFRHQRSPRFYTDF
jgi:hypothetical protein